MKLAVVNTIVLVAILTSTPFSAASKGKKKGDDVEGESSLKTENGDCKIACEWSANFDRKLINGPREMTTVYWKQYNRKLDVELKHVECTAEIDGVEYTKDIPFPEDWDILEQKADGTDDSFGFSTTFKFEDAAGIVVAEGELGVDFEIVEEEDEAGNTEDVLSFDGQDIGVTCL